MISRLLDRFTPVQLTGAFLAYLTVLQFAYPITLYGPGWRLGYQVCYTALWLLAAWSTRTNPRSSIVGLASVAAFAISCAYQFAYPTDAVATLVAYAALVPFQLTLIRRFWRFMRRRDRESLPDVLAAVSIYLLVGAAFVPAYGALEMMAPHSFVDAADPEVVVEWQNFIYYSYVTLNTVGFGDIRPVSDWARSLSNLEAMIGVLYVAILLTHLIGGVRQTAMAAVDEAPLDEAGGEARTPGATPAPRGS